MINTKNFKNKTEEINSNLLMIFNDKINRDIPNDYFYYLLINEEYKVNKLLIKCYLKNVIAFENYRYLINSYNNLFELLSFTKNFSEACALIGSIEYNINSILRLGDVND